MKQLSILIALILFISAGVQAKKYKVFYLGGQSNMDGLWIIRSDINDMKNKGEIILYQSEDGIGVSALLDFTKENMTKIAQNSIATIKNLIYLLMSKRQKAGLGKGNWKSKLAMADKKKNKQEIVRSSAAEYLTFIAAHGEGGVEAVYADENIWLTQKMMGQLYRVETHTVNYHLKKIFADSELQEDSVIREFRITASDGKSYNTKHYNLSAIIAVGYKVNSERAVQFRKWATGIIQQFTIKGFAMDDERLKNDGTILGKKYFEEQLQRIREIRLSERKFYQKITDIYSTAIDYDVNSQATRRFFATVQNKLHWAIHGQTAAELILDRANHIKENMGLTTWTDAPKGKIQKFDVSVAKNYLSENEMQQLQRLVSAYLDIAEDMAIRQIPMTMEDWETRLNKFIAVTDRGILQDSGKVSAEIAKAHAESEFEIYRIIQDRLFESDFDREMKKLSDNL